MNRNRLMFIGFVALALGFLVSYAVYHSLRGSGNAGSQIGMDVVVAAKDIPVGAKIEESDLRTVRMPQSDVPPNSYADTSKIVGRGAVLPIPQGDFVLRGKLAGEDAGSGLPSLIPRGMRAVSVRVNEVVGVAGFVQPGTRVDVLVTGTPVGGGEVQTTTVLSNVAVIASGQQLERTARGEAQNAPVITLLVSPDDAQRLALASSQGHIQLALRNPLDTGDTGPPATSFGSVFGEISKPAAPVVHRLRHVIHEPAPPTPYSVEVYRGDKKDVTKFQGQD